MNYVRFRRHLFDSKSRNVIRTSARLLGSLRQFEVVTAAHIGFYAPCVPFNILHLKKYICQLKNRNTKGCFDMTAKKFTSIVYGSTSMGKGKCL